MIYLVFTLTFLLVIIPLTVFPIYFLLLFYRSVMKFLKKEIPIPRFFSLLLLFSTIVIPTCLISYLIHSYNFDYGKLNNIGGTFGFLNPIVAMFAALITYCAFYVQYQANKTIIEENKKERVINRFYELLRTHKENVNELKADDYIYEYEDVFCDNHWKNHIRLKKVFNIKDERRLCAI